MCRKGVKAVGRKNASLRFGRTDLGTSSVRILKQETRHINRRFARWRGLAGQEPRPAMRDPYGGYRQNFSGNGVLRASVNKIRSE